ncbi:mevalonate kinase [Microbacterium radiodurans]|uniref:Mevalonate kinase n=1 Tax=Microbacterium radiodurans TaxID=661398 RepID=A0A5J5IRN3_9MICO|nr:mevalonate kinase [Microbacterium radiodurans]KAA9086711.1 mevalonate kinase [Microbacterium radiodurans]
MTASTDVPLAPDAPPQVTHGTTAAPAATGRAGAKAILIGEHAVVYGRPALAIPVRALEARAEARAISGPSRLRSALYTGQAARAPERLRVTVTAMAAALEAAGSPDTALEIAIESSIPAERGLGSSAAVSAAVIEAALAACGARVDDERMHELIQTAERAAHGSPSGLDARTVRARAAVWFEAGRIEPVSVGSDLTFVIADSGVRGRTREAVAAVAARRAADPAAVDASLDELGALATAVRGQVSAGESDGIGAAMTRAHTLLNGLGVGDPALDRLFAAAVSAGALGAKLTGGGRGGCVLALVRDTDAAAELSDHLTRVGAAAVWTTTVEGGA